MNCPVSLSGFFVDDDEELEQESFDQNYEVQEFKIGDSVLFIRQFCWHRANGNQVNYYINVAA